MDGAVYHRMLPPSLDLVDHANKLGINLRSRDLLAQNQPSAARRSAVRRGSPRLDVTSTSTLLSQGHQGSRHGSARTQLRSASLGGRMRLSATPIYIHNVVVPLQNAYGFSTQTERSYPSSRHSPRRSHQSSRVKSADSLHGHGKGVSHFPARPPNSRVQSAYGDRSRHGHTSTPRENSAVGNHGVGNHGKNSSNGASGQSLRYKMEQDEMMKCQTRKRASQISDHRVDRMYYMTGNNFRLQHKYHVEDEELQRLKEMSRARKQATHYGRGLSSHRGDHYVPDQNKTPEPTTKRSELPSSTVDGSEEMTVDAKQSPQHGGNSENGRGESTPEDGPEETTSHHVINDRPGQEVNSEDHHGNDIQGESPQINESAEVLSQPMSDLNIDDGGEVGSIERTASPNNDDDGAAEGITSGDGNQGDEAGENQTESNDVAAEKDTDHQLPGEGSDPGDTTT